jgi:hypothetical protein
MILCRWGRNLHMQCVTFLVAQWLKFFQTRNHSPVVLVNLPAADFEQNVNVAISLVCIRSVLVFLLLYFFKVFLYILPLLYMYIYQSLAIS